MKMQCHNRVQSEQRVQPFVDSLAPLTLAMMPRKEGSLSRTLGAVIIVSTSGSSDPCIR